MRRNTLLIAMVALLVLCFATLAACSGNVAKVDDYVEKLNTKDDFITILEESTDTYTKVTEVLISGNRIQVLSVKTIEGQDKAERDDKYYEVLDDTHVRVYSTFECTEHAKGDKPVTEWKYDDITVTENYLTKARAELRDMASKFALKGDDLEWSKEKEGFVYVNGKGATESDYTDVVVNAASGALKIDYKNEGVSSKVSYMNFGTARVSFPILCKTYQNKLDGKE